MNRADDDYEQYDDDELNDNTAIARLSGHTGKFSLKTVC